MRRWHVLLIAVALGALAAALVTFGPWVAFRVFHSRIERTLDARVRVGSIIGRWGRVVLTDVRIGDNIRFRRATMYYKAARLLLGRVALDPVVIEQADFSLGPGDIALLREKQGSGGSGSGALELGVVRLVSSILAYHDEELGLSFRAGIEAVRRPGERPRATLRDAAMTLAAGPAGGARRIDIVMDEAGPTVDLQGGRVVVSRWLTLSDIEGVLSPIRGGRHSVRLSGGWGDAGAQLWTATGQIAPGGGHSELRLRAERFRLDRLGSVLKHAPIQNPERTEIDADLNLHQSDGSLDFEGMLSVTGLTIYHPALAPAAILDLSASLKTKGRFEPRTRRLVLDEIIAEHEGVQARFAGLFERLGTDPLIEASFDVIPVRCQRLLSAVPEELLPVVRRFQLDGTFEASVRTRIDFAALEDVVLDGKVGIDGCKVLSAPEEANAEALLQPFTHHVHPTPDIELAIEVGPVNPDFVPYPEISPHIVNSIMTTEDSKFFEHSGFIPREFRTALSRDLRERRFAFGASSITMQMVKNVLLSPEKTLSRKLQELFLTWYVERNLSKERILEIYLNVIEFGPGIWGIGPASRHYFGKRPAEITPREAAFFSSILPSPKRRYVQYCGGAPTAKWERYLDRILRRMQERDRLTDEEFEEATRTTLVFDRKEARPERDCLRFVEQLLETNEVPILVDDEPTQEDPAPDEDESDTASADAGAPSAAADTASADAGAPSATADTASAGAGAPSAATATPSTTTGTPSAQPPSPTPSSQE